MDNDLGLIQEGNVAVANHPDKNHQDDLGLVADPSDKQKEADVSEFGLVNDHGNIIDPKMAVDKSSTTPDPDLGLQAGPDTKIHQDMSALFTEDNKQNPALDKNKNKDATPMEAFGIQAINKSVGIIPKVVSGQPMLSDGEKEAVEKHPVADFLGQAVGGAAAFGAMAAIPEVSLPVAFGAASVLSGVSEQAEHIKDANDQLSVGQRLGKVGVDAVAGAIMGKIFDTAQVGKTILDRTLQRAGGSGATAITQSLANQTVEGKEPDAGVALAQGGLQALTIGLVAGMSEVPHLRSLVMEEAKSKIDENGNVMGQSGFYKVDADKLSMDQAKKILDDHLINPESLSPEFQKAVYEQKKDLALDNIDVKAKQYGVDPDIIKQVINDKNVESRANTLSEYLAKMVKTDPATVKKLLPFFDAIKHGIDPVDVILMSDVLTKFNTGAKVEQVVGQSKEGELASQPKAETATPAGEKINPAENSSEAIEQPAAQPNNPTNENLLKGASQGAAGVQTIQDQAQAPIVQPQGTESGLSGATDKVSDQEKQDLGLQEENPKYKLEDTANPYLEHLKAQRGTDQYKNDKSYAKDIEDKIAKEETFGPKYKSQPSWDDLIADKSKYEQANQAGMALIKKHLPQLADSLVNPAYIYTKDGARALGMYYQGRLHIKSGSGLNVYVHELGHAAFDLFLTPTEKDALLAEGKKIYGEKADVEERIMEDFEKYAKDQRFIPDDSAWGKFKSLFRGLKNRVLKFVGIDPVSIKGFYDAILKGDYASKQPNKTYSEEAKYKQDDQIEYKGPTILDPAFAAIAKASKEIQALVAPRTLVNRDYLDVIMKMKGQRDKLEFVLEQKLLKLEKAFDKMPQEEKVAFVDNIKLGRKQATEALQSVADMMRTVEDKHWALAKEFKPSLAYKENHYRVMWKVIPGSDTTKGGFHGLFKRPFQGTQGWAKKSTLIDMSEGIAAGGVPYSFNPMTMWKNSIMDMNQFITARRMWQGLKEAGAVQFVRVGKNAEYGKIPLEDAISHVYFPIVPEYLKDDAKLKEIMEGMDLNRISTEIGKYFVDEGAARILNNFLGKDNIRSSQIGGSLLAFKNFTTGIELSLSPFHAAYVSLMASSSSMGLGLQKIANRGFIQKDMGTFIDGLKDIGTGMVPLAAPTQLYKLGSAAIKYLSGEEFQSTKEVKDFIKQYPEAAELLNDLFIGGGKLAIHQDYKINAIQAMTQGLRDFTDAKNSFKVAQENGDVALMQKYSAEMAKNAFAEVFHLLPSINQVIMRPLFEIYIPRLKIGSFLKEYSNDLVARRDQLESGRLTRAELARDTWDSIERRFGEMNFDNLFWNRNFKTSLQLLFRSVTWKYGALQNIGGAGTGSLKDLSVAIQDKTLPKLNRNLASLLGLCLMVTVFAEILQKLLTDKHLGERDDGKFDLGVMFKDMLDPRYNANGDRLFFNTHLKDWAHLFHSPGGFLSNSLSGMFGRAMEDWKNKDFFNVQIHNPNDPWYKQDWDMLVHMIPLPFSLTNQGQLKTKNAPDAVKALTALGFTTPAPGYVNDTPVMSLAKEMMGNKPYNQITKTEEQGAHSKEISQLKQTYYATKDPAPLLAAEKAGKITFDQYLKIKQDAKENPLARIAKSRSMAFDDVASLLDKAIETKSVDEQNILWPILKEKYFNAQERAKPEDMKQNMELYKDIKTKLGK